MQKGQIVSVHSASLPQRVTLRGQYVHIVPLDAAAHAPTLFSATCGLGNASLFDYLFDGPFVDESSFLRWAQSKQSLQDPLFFTLVHPVSNVPLGLASLMRQDPTNRVIEIGNILYTPALQRTPAATEAMALFAAYVFEDLGYRRYEWKCNALNTPSRRAALRLGFQFEGIFRQHMIVKGHNRDTAWFSMLDHEWPARKAAFTHWLNPKNFDAQGQQIRGLNAAAHS